MDRIQLGIGCEPMLIGCDLNSNMDRIQFFPVVAAHIKADDLNSNMDRIQSGLRSLKNPCLNLFKFQYG